MEREDILRMAEKAGFGQVTRTLPLEWKGYSCEALERFAHLVAAAERERCAEICSETDDLPASTCAKLIRELS